MSFQITDTQVDYAVNQSIIIGEQLFVSSSW